MWGLGGEWVVWEEDKQDCLIPFQADANEPTLPLTSLPEKQVAM